MYFHSYIFLYFWVFFINNLCFSEITERKSCSQRTFLLLFSPFYRYQRWADCEIFQYVSSPDPIKLNLICKIFENHQSDPVLLCQWKNMYFYFASWGKNTTETILPLAKYDWLKQNTSSSAFASWGKIDTAFWHFQNLARKCLLGMRGKTTAGVILPLGESDCLDWTSDKNDTLGLV